MNSQCEHGRALGKKCGRCEDEREIAELHAKVERLEDENHALACARDHLLRVLEEERKGGKKDVAARCAEICIENIQNVQMTRSAVVMKIKKEFL